MSDKFDPTPADKHAEDPMTAARADQAQHDRLEQGLEGSFPASDPPSVVPPAVKSDPNAHPTLIEKCETGPTTIRHS